MRLGAYRCVLKTGSVVQKAYGVLEVSERHRHRYEFNLAYREVFESHGIVFSGMSPDGSLLEIFELQGHPWFVACQFHPELQSRPMEPHPLFRGLVEKGLALRARTVDRHPS